MKSEINEALLNNDLESYIKKREDKVRNDTDLWWLGFSLLVCTIFGGFYILIH